MRDRLGSIRPSKLSSRPRHSMPALDAALTTARMTALRPGASPPPVRTPIRVIAGILVECSRADALRLSKRAWYNRRSVRGRLAQLGERRVRNAEVGSSSLLPSTILRSRTSLRASVWQATLLSKRGSFSCLFLLYRALWTFCGQIKRVERRDAPFERRMRVALEH